MIVLKDIFESNARIIGYEGKLYRDSKDNMHATAKLHYKIGRQDKEGNYYWNQGMGAFHFKDIDE